MSQIEGFALALQRWNWNQEGFVLQPKASKERFKLKNESRAYVFWGFFFGVLLFFFFEDYIKKLKQPQTDWFIIKALRQLQYVSVLAWPRGGKL